MAGILGIKPRHQLAPPRVGDVQHSRASITAAAELIGYQPVAQLADGLKETLDFYAAGLGSTRITRSV